MADIDYKRVVENVKAFCAKYSISTDTSHSSVPIRRLKWLKHASGILGRYDPLDLQKLFEEVVEYAFCGLDDCYEIVSFLLIMEQKINNYIRKNGFDLPDDFVRELRKTGIIETVADIVDRLNDIERNPFLGNAKKFMKRLVEILESAETGSWYSAYDKAKIVAFYELSSDERILAVINKIDVLAIKDFYSALVYKDYARLYVTVMNMLENISKISPKLEEFYREIQTTAKIE